MVSRWSAPVWADTLFTCAASWEPALGQGRADEAKPTKACCNASHEVPYGQPSQTRHAVVVCIVADGVRQIVPRRLGHTTCLW